MGKQSEALNGRTGIIPQSKEKPTLCYQCGKCSAGCPIAEEMDVLPHQVMHYLALGKEDPVLRSKTIWMCAGCYTCATRCPNEIDITSVMDDMREKAVRKGLACPKPDVLRFHRAFLRDMKRRGRIHEARMMGEYNLSRRKPFDNMGLAVKMFLRGRIKPFPPRRSAGFRKWMRRICGK